MLHRASAWLDTVLFFCSHRTLTGFGNRTAGYIQNPLVPPGAYLGLSCSFAVLYYGIERKRR